MERKFSSVLNPENSNEIFFKRELFSVIKEKGRNLINSNNREGFLSEFGDLLFTVDEIIKSEQVTDQELAGIEEVNMIKNIGFDGRIFLHWATDDDGPSKGKRVSLETLITDGFFRRIKNDGAEFSFKKLDDISFEKELLKKLKENGSNLVLVRNREQFLSEFGGLLFLVDEIIKFKKITDMEIEQMETVKNRQK